MQLKTSQLEHCWQRGATKARFPDSRILFALVASLFAWASFPVDVTGAELQASELTFEKDIRPIFREHCYDCHGATDQLEGNLDLRLVRFMVRGGESGPAILANQPEQSLLVSRLRAGEMPPGAVPVPEEQIATIERWIAAGAPTARPEPETIGPGLGISAEERDFWSFRPVVAPPIPDIVGSRRIRTPIDAFVLEGMPSGLSLLADAPRATLVKRAYFELIGLPPSPEEMARWLAAPEQTWFSDLIDHLLDSPHYGEHWARHWLDVAGYADSEGQSEQDKDRKWAWQYRDWVIRAFNDNKPFDRFLVEQFAGDELAGPKVGEWTPAQRDLLAATGFLRMAADGTGSGADKLQDRNRVIADTLQIVCTSVLGLTVHCAECHDHRYDPIPQSDYYALRAIFEPALDFRNWRPPEKRLVSFYTEADRRGAAKIEEKVQEVIRQRNVEQAEYMEKALVAELEKHPEPRREAFRTAFETKAKERSEEQTNLLHQDPRLEKLTTGTLYLYINEWRGKRDAWVEKIEATKGEKPPPNFVRALVESPGNTPETKLFHRGLVDQPRQTVLPASLKVTSPEGLPKLFAENAPTLPTTGRRLAFARWLTSGEHPLVGRVIVNRIWMHHFGSPLVGTPGDFGKLGQRPTQPELLDWLATEFARSGWNFKQLHRLIMASAVWRQASFAPLEPSEEDSAAPPPVDPENRYLARRSMRRLGAEAIRDRMLACGGGLTRELYGPPQGLKADYRGQTIVDGTPNRRSLYVRVQRTQPLDMLHTFDAPVMETNCQRRTSTAAATQALMMMNSEFAYAQAGKVAARAAQEASPPSEETRAKLPSLPQAPTSAWQFGYGTVDVEAGQTASFTPLPVWEAKNKQWLGDSSAEDYRGGHVHLTATGGVPDGNGDAVRRWRAPAAGMVSIRGALAHGTDSGNGVQGYIAISKGGLHGGWVVLNGQTETNLDGIRIESGDTIDFVVNNNGSTSSDHFSWEVMLTLAKNTGGEQSFSSTAGFHGPLEDYEALWGQIDRAWEIVLCRKPTIDEWKLAIDLITKQTAYFESHPEQVETIKLPGFYANDIPTVTHLVLTNLCQSLMGCNEFLYVD